MVAQASFFHNPYMYGGKSVRGFMFPRPLIAGARLPLAFVLRRVLPKRVVTTNVRVMKTPCRQGRFLAVAILVGYGLGSVAPSMAASAHVQLAAPAGRLQTTRPRPVALKVFLSPAAPGRVLTLRDAISRALAHQALVLQAQHLAAAQAALRQAAHADLLPSLSLAGGGIWTQTRDSQPVFVSANGAREVLAQITLHVPVYSPSAYALEALARDRLMTARYRERQARLAVAAEVTAAYYRLALLDNEEKVWRRALRAAQQLRTATTKSYEAGTRSRLDVTQAELSVANAQAGLDRTVPLVRAAVRVLALETAYTPLSLPPLPRMAPPTGILPPSTVLDARADRRQPLIQVADSQIRAAKATVRLRQAARLPVVAVDGGYGVDTTNTPQARNLGWQAAVTLHMPLFGFGRNRDRIDAAREQRMAMEAGRDALLLNVHARIASDYGLAEAAEKAVQNERRIARDAQTVSAMTRKGYLIGTLSALALSQAENNWVQARLAYAGAAIRAQLAQAQLDLDVGTLPHSKEIP